MTEQTPPTIEFPCPNYPIKVVGVSSDDYQQRVLEIVSVHAPDCDWQNTQVRDSGKGKFRSITLYIEAQGPEQLKRIHQDLMAFNQVRMVI